VIQVVVATLCLGIFVLVMHLRSSKSSGRHALVQQSLPLVQMFLQRTGYTYADGIGGNLQATASRWQQAWLAAMEGQSYNIHLVRSFHGLAVHWQHATRAAYGQISWSQTWWCKPPSPLRTHFHISERSNLDPARAGNWQPAFARQCVTGDAHVDHRFVVFVPHEESAVRAVLANPTLRNALLQCSFVDMRVVADGVSFSDPLQTNAVQMLGGPVAAAAVLSDPGRTLEMTLPLHDHIASVLGGAVSLCR
jgi:hypothetical protein